MPRFESDSDARRLGEALAALRLERGFSQAQAGERVGMTSQGWGLYERADPDALFVRGLGGGEERIARPDTRQVSVVVARLDL